MVYHLGFIRVCISSLPVACQQLSHQIQPFGAAMVLLPMGREEPEYFWTVNAYVWAGGPTVMVPARSHCCVLLYSYHLFVAQAPEGIAAHWYDVTICNTVVDICSWFQHTCISVLHFGPIWLLTKRSFV